MTLARQSPRTCLIWRNLGQRFGTRAGEKLWQAFYHCLEELGRPVDESEAAKSTEAKIVEFLRELLALSTLDAAAGDLMDQLARSQPDDGPSVLEILGKWQEHAVVERLFDHEIDRAAASFYLGQMAYVLGLLRVAKDYAIDAYRVLPLDSPAGGTDPDRALTILEFLIVTLVLEINFLAEGRTFSLSEGLKSLDQRKQRLARDFVDMDRQRLREIALGEHGQESETHRPFVSELRAAITNDGAQEPLTARPEELEDLDLAFELSRKNHAGMLLFRMRHWRDAEEAFKGVVTNVRRRRESCEEKALLILIPLELEARVYLGRLAAQRCDFSSAEKELTHAIRQFEAMDDFFAANKARRYLAEVKYRQLSWVPAENLLLEVIHTSERLHFEHDAAVAETILGKLYSRFGFQDWAIALFEGAHEQFRDAGASREYIDCIFWQAAAQARYLGLNGHPKGNVVNARAMVYTYRQLFECVQGDSIPPEIERDLVSMERFQNLRRATLYERHPTLLGAMLDLRLGRLPSTEDLSSLADLANRGDAAVSGWTGEAHAYLCRQLVRLVHIQRAELHHARQWASPPRVESSEELRKYFVRDAFIDSLVAVVEPKDWNAHEICACLQRTYERRQELHLKGGFVPSLVDISQFFADRTCYIGLLLLLQLAIDESIGEATTRPAAPALDVALLKDIYRSITRYLVLERNLYMGSPAFTATNAPALWRRLEEVKPVRDRWLSLYQSTLIGKYGITYPTHAVALGWVDSYGRASAILSIVWLDEHHGRPLTAESFKPLEVPIRVLEAGHAVERLAPIVLIGRIETDKKGNDWVAHRLPSLDKWRLFEEDRFGEPRIEKWQEIFLRLAGVAPAVCTTPEVSSEEVRDRARHYARLWFQDTLPAPFFEHVFGVAIDDRRRPEEATASPDRHPRREPKTSPLAPDWIERLVALKERDPVVESFLNQVELDWVAPVLLEG